MATSMDPEHHPSPMSSGTGVGDVPGMHTLLSNSIPSYINNIIFKTSKPRGLLDLAIIKRA